MALLKVVNRVILASIKMKGAKQGANHVLLGLTALSLDNPPATHAPPALIRQITELARQSVKVKIFP